MTNPVHMIVDCGNLGLLPTVWVRTLVMLQKNLGVHHKQVRFVHVSEKLMRFLKQEGLNSTFKVSTSSNAALIDMGLKTAPKTLDVDFINPFLTATTKVLETQASTKAQAGKIYKRETNDGYLGDISGVIGLISDNFTGSVVISFPGATFLKIMSRMLGEEFTVINKDIEDGAGEITNIIFGQAKVTLNEKGFGINTALPSVVSGKEHTIKPMATGQRMVIPFETDVGPFFVEICLAS